MGYALAKDCEFEILSILEDALKTSGEEKLKDILRDHLGGAFVICHNNIKK